MSSFLSFLDICSRYASNNSDMIACVGSNVDLHKVNDANIPSFLFYTTVTSLSLILVISRPTCILRTSCTLIDNIFVSISKSFKSGIMTFDITDHSPIFSVYKYSSQKKCPPT